VSWLFPSHPSSLFFRLNMRLLAALLLLLAAPCGFASLADSTLEKRKIRSLSPGAITAFKPYSFYAASAYCDPSALKTWTCGGWYKGSTVVFLMLIATFSQLQRQLRLPAHCSRWRRSSDTILCVYTGHFRVRSLRWVIGYVGYDKSLNTIIVGHQGTDPLKMCGYVSHFGSYGSLMPFFGLSISILVDADLILDDLKPSLFPGVSSSVRVHNGFGEAQERCVLSPHQLGGFV
jgi:hypothetical protein